MTWTVPTPEQVRSATPAELLPHFDRLAEAPLTPATLDEWLSRWSALEAAISEAIARAAIGYARNTADADAGATNARIGGEIAPWSDEQHVRLARRLLELNPADLGPDLAPLVAAARDDQATMRPEHAALRRDLAALDMRYQQITGGLTAEWEGQQVPLDELVERFGDPDRVIRERAIRGWLDAYVGRRDPLAGIFDEQYRLRQEVARTAGFANYLDFAYREKHRPYSPALAESFHQAVERSVAPALARRYERRRVSLDLDRLRAWDTEADPSGQPPLRPAGTSEELLDGIERIICGVHPEFGARFARLRADGRIDIEPRLGKEPGGFCLPLDVSRSAFIFGTMLHTHDDVTLMLHEGGHALHGLSVYDRDLLVFQQFPGAEMAELVSMSMELLGGGSLAREAGGFYPDADARRAQVCQLESILSLLVYIAQIDAFQTWLYTSGQGHDRDARDAAWVATYRRFPTGVDWSTYPEGLTARWYQQSLIFVAPLYMIEYGIAQLGALTVWRTSLTDPVGAVDALRAAMALGNTRFAPELYAAAGVPFTFTAESVAEVVTFIEERLATLEGGPV